jgi:hypothetical protein
MKPLEHCGLGLAGSGAPSRSYQLTRFKTPSQAQEPYHLDAEIPLDETARLLFFTFNGTPIVQVVRRKPKPKNPKTHGPSVFAPFFWLGLIARAVRAGYYAVKGYLSCLTAGWLYPARFVLPSPHRPSHSLRLKAHQTHLEANTGLFNQSNHTRLPKP